MADGGDTSGGVDRDRDQIATPDPILMFGMVGQEPLGGGEKAGSLGRTYGIVGATGAFATTGLDLHEDQHVTVERDEIEFTALAIPIARDEAVAVRFEEAEGVRLTCLPENALAFSGGHDARPGQSELAKSNSDEWDRDRESATPANGRAPRIPCFGRSQTPRTADRNRA